MTTLPLKACLSVPIHLYQLVTTTSGRGMEDCRGILSSAIFHEKTPTDYRVPFKTVQD